jgi:hypothetical protein
MSNGTKSKSAVLPGWGESTRVDHKRAVDTKPVFPIGLHKPAEFQRALRLIQLALAAELSKSETRSKGSATTIAGEFTKLMKNMAHFVAKTPSIAGDTGGVSLENAQVAATRVKESIAHYSAQGHAFAETKVGWGTISLVTTSYIDLISRLANVSDDQGRITTVAVASALGVKAQFYPAQLGAVLGRIQAAYDDMPLDASPDVLRAITAITGRGDLTGIRKMNSCLGQLQLAVPIFAATAVKMPSTAAYRRDVRPVYNEKGVRVADPTDVIPFSTHAARAVLSSGLEMSMALGDVTRITEVAATATAPKSTSYRIKKTSHFAEIIRLAIETKRYFNNAGPKDLQQYLATHKSNATIHTRNITWKSLTEEADYYHFATASLILEVETRLRIADTNNADVVKADGIVAGPRPDSKKIKAQNWVHFLKAPRELLDAAELAKISPTYQAFAEQATLRQDSARRFLAILNSHNGDYRAFVDEISRFSDEISKVCQNIMLTQIVRIIADSTTNAAATKAKVTKPPRA